jgi:hypothetical protein
MTHNQRHAKAIDEWTALFKAGKLVCVPFNLSDLPASTRDYLEEIVVPAGLELRQGPTIEEQLLIQIVGDDVVGFLGHCPVCRSHTWGSPDFGDVEPNDVLARLFHLRDPNLNEAESRDILTSFDDMQKRIASAQYN